MKVISPDIAWHGQRQRILSLDFHPFLDQFATAGSQQRIFSQQQKQIVQQYSGCIKIWQLNIPSLHLVPQCKYGLSQVITNVNCIKYSPDGRFLAFATDGHDIYVYSYKEYFKSISNSEKVCKWSSYCKFFGHGKDVVDIAWCKNSTALVSASMDGTVKFWQIDINKRKEAKHVTTFQKSVQGVAVHPNIDYIIAVGNDQVAKMIAPTTGNKKNKLYDTWYVRKNFQKYHFKKGVVQKDELQPFETQKHESFKMFANESISSFFRRPSISPDGQLFILPCGIWKNNPTDQPKCCSYLFRKNYFSKPSFAIQTNKQPVLICKFCPMLFQKKNPQQGLFKQAYYMVFAIATTNSVLIYSTDSLKPLYGMGNFHFAALTDLAWKDDKVLAISSSDGYLSFLTFQTGELGEIYYPQEGPLKDMVTRTPYVEKMQERPQQNANRMVPEQQQQRIQITQTAQGIKKKIIPRIISTNK